MGAGGAIQQLGLRRLELHGSLLEVVLQLLLVEGEPRALDALVFVGLLEFLHLLLHVPGED